MLLIIWIILVIFLDVEPTLLLWRRALAFAFQRVLVVVAFLQVRRQARLWRCALSHVIFVLLISLWLLQRVSYWLLTLGSYSRRKRRWVVIDVFEFLALFIARLSPVLHLLTLGR